MAPSVRLTRSALKKISAEEAEKKHPSSSVPLAIDTTSPSVIEVETVLDDSQLLVGEYHTFKSGLTPVKRRRVVPGATSDIEETTTTEETENIPPASSSPRLIQDNKMTMVTSCISPVESSCMDLNTASISSPVPPLVPILPELSLATDEKALEGAPEGELYVVTVLDRKDVLPSTQLSRELDELNHVLTTKQQTETLTVDHHHVTWAEDYAALDTVRRLAIHHGEALRPIVERVLTLIVCPAVSNLRSAMARNALLCIQDLLLCLEREMISFCDTLIPLLIHRSTNEKHFIRDLAHQTLLLYVEKCYGKELLDVLVQHGIADKRNSQKMSVASVYVSHCMDPMDPMAVKAFVMDESRCFMSDMSAFLQGKVVEGKAATRKILQQVRRVLGDEEFTSFVSLKLSGSTRTDVLQASERANSKVTTTTRANGTSTPLSMRERMLQMKKQQSKQEKSSSNEAVIVVAPPSLR